MVSNNNKNIKKTSIIVLAIILFKTLIVFYILHKFVKLHLAIIIAISYSLITSFILYMFSTKIILSLNKTKLASKQDYIDLYSLLENISNQANISTPYLYIIQSDQPNSFATGKNPKNSALCITTGLLEKLDYNELEAVLAHEISHIKNSDILLSNITTVMIGMVAILSDLFSRYSYKKSLKNKKTDSNSFSMVIGLVLSVLSPISGKIMELILPKNKEYLADKYAIKLTKNPQSLINALSILENDSTAMEYTNSSTAHMYIVDPFKEINGQKVGYLFNTHPSIEKRIEALEKLK